MLSGSFHWRPRPIRLPLVEVCDLGQGRFQVLPLAGDRHLATRQHNLTGAVKEAVVLLGDAPHHFKLHPERNRLLEAQVQIDGEPPDFLVPANQNGAPDGLVEDRRGDPAVQPSRVALMLFGRGEGCDEFALSVS